MASTGIVSNRDRAELSKGIGDEGSDPWGATEWKSLGWEIDFPHELFRMEQLEGWTSLQEAASYRCRSLATNGVVAQVESSREWTVSEAERCWYETLLFMAQPLEELMVRVCSLKTDVPLSPEEP